MKIKNLNRELGNADLILIDQILKNRFDRQMRILDAGCGEGRNMVFFVKNQYQIYGIDKNEEAVKMARVLCRSLNKEYDTSNIQQFPIENNPFPDGFFDAVICINVLHNVSDRAEFLSLFSDLIRLLDSGGILFLSMESRIGISGRYVEQENASLVDPSGYFYFSEDLRREIFSQSIWTEIEPVKTILIDDTKSCTYLLLKKNN